MNSVAIERLTLHLSNLSEGDSRRLAELLAARLAEASLEAGEVASLALTVQGQTGEGLERLSERIAAALLRRLHG